MQPITFFLALIFFSCTMQEPDKEESFSYDLSAPDQVYRMPKPLKEISGISLFSGNIIACVEDNHGIIYLYDLKKKKLNREIRFGDDGDFEDIACIGRDFYVLRSDGYVFKIRDRETESYPTLLDAENNTEGMCFNKQDSSLLIACKDDPGKMVDRNHKSVYKFSLADRSMKGNPEFSISIEDIEQNKDAGPDAKHFSPSGIAIHPKSGNIFIISSRGNILLESDRTGKILHAEKIYGKLFPQPEGICFTVDGDLLISNEGRDHEEGTILRFKQK